MTCIVAVEHEGKVYMGGDSMGTNGWDAHVIEFKKVFHKPSLSGKFLFGYTTSFRMGQLLQFELSIPQQEEESDMNYMVTKFVPAVQKLFKDKGFSKVENNQEEGGSFLVGYKGKVYQVENDFQVMRHRNGLYAVGCGRDYALGSLATSQGGIMERILTALVVAGEFSIGVCGPYYVEVQ